MMTEKEILFRKALLHEQAAQLHREDADRHEEKAQELREQARRLEAESGLFDKKLSLEIDCLHVLIESGKTEAHR